MSRRRGMLITTSAWEVGHLAAKKMFPYLTGGAMNLATMITIITNRYKKYPWFKGVVVDPLYTPYRTGRNVHPALLLLHRRPKQNYNHYRRVYLQQQSLILVCTLEAMHMDKFMELYTGRQVNE